MVHASCICHWKFPYFSPSFLSLRTFCMPGPVQGTGDTKINDIPCPWRIVSPIYSLGGRQVYMRHIIYILMADALIEIWTKSYENRGGLITDGWLGSTLKWTWCLNWILTGVCQLREKRFSGKTRGCAKEWTHASLCFLWGRMRSVMNGKLGRMGSLGWEMWPGWKVESLL